MDDTADIKRQLDYYRRLRGEPTDDFAFIDIHMPLEATNVELERRELNPMASSNQDCCSEGEAAGGGEEKPGDDV